MINALLMVLFGVGVGGLFLMFISVWRMHNEIKKMKQEDKNSYLKWKRNTYDRYNRGEKNQA